MTIRYGKILVPDCVIERAREGCKLEGPHLIWIGANSGTRQIPQIGFTTKIQDKKVVKVLSVAKLLFTVRYNVFPYQIRRDRALCTEKLCVNPEHFYAIPEKPSPENKEGQIHRVRYID